MGIRNLCLIEPMMKNWEGEMPDVYKAGDYDLAGFAVGVCELKRMVRADKCESGDVILGLASSGVHSNGYTLVRAIVREAKLDLLKVYHELDDPRPLGQVLLTPTRIYARSIVSLLRAYKVKRPIRGMAHITGGGLPGNVNRALGGHLNAKIDPRRWPVSPLFEFLQRYGNVDGEEMFRVFNMGIGYVLIVRPHFAEAVADRLTRAGEQVFKLGRITRGTGRVVLG